MSREVKTSRDLCIKHGGQTALNKIIGVPVDTANKWSSGKSNQPEYIVKLIDWAIEKGYRIK